MPAIWTAPSAGTMIDLDERRFYAARLDVYGQGQIVYWTEDGEADGASLFGTSFMPLVEVTIADHTTPSAWTRDGNWGAMMHKDYVDFLGPYSWTTEYDSGNAVWYTTVALGSPYGTAQSTGYQQKRPAWAFAMGGAS